MRVNRVSWASAAESWEVRTVGARSYVSFGSDSRVPPRGRAVLLAVSGRWLPCHQDPTDDSFDEVLDVDLGEEVEVVD